jgi:hypothetical protein
MSDTRKMRGNLRAYYDAVPQQGEASTVEIASRLNRCPMNTATRLRLLAARGLLKRSGRGVPRSPYRWSRVVALAALLAGCPASLRSDGLTADCCEPDSGVDGGCEWAHLEYTVPLGTDSFADDDRACMRAGLEPYR